MTRTRMHDDEIHTDADLVSRLLADQFPQWADLPVGVVESYGTDHDIYRVGDHLTVRLPRTEDAVSQATKDATWLPHLAPHVPLAVPEPLALGRPGEGYPFRWSVCAWLPGRDAARDLADLDQAATDLASFIRALRGVDTADAPPRQGSRGGPLADIDGPVRHSIDLLGDRVDGPTLTRAWEESATAPTWNGPQVWIHGDLLPGNLLVVDGRLSAVIDFGTLTVGDPAGDLLPAWNVFTGPSRDRFHAELAVDDASRLRGRGWALAQAVVALPYYWDTNPGILAQAQRALDEIVASA